MSLKNVKSKLKINITLPAQTRVVLINSSVVAVKQPRAHNTNEKPRNRTNILATTNAIHRKTRMTKE